MKIFENFLKILNLHPKRFPSRGHDPIFGEKCILTRFGPYRAPFGPKMGPIWKFSKIFSKFLISTPNEFHRGVMTLYFEKSRFWPVFGPFRAPSGPKMGPIWKFSKIWFCRYFLLFFSYFCWKFQKNSPDGSPELACWTIRTLTI